MAGPQTPSPLSLDGVTTAIEDRGLGGMDGAAHGLESANVVPSISGGVSRASLALTQVRATTNDAASPERGIRGGWFDCATDSTQASGSVFQLDSRLLLRGTGLQWL